jgi:hypothetical protein
MSIQLLLRYGQTIQSCGMIDELKFGMDQLCKYALDYLGIVQCVSFKYLDEEGDWVLITNESDLLEAISLVADAGHEALEIIVEGNKRKNLPLFADFVEHVTIQERTQISGLNAFVKTWKMKNSGLEDWPEGIILAFDRGDECFKAESKPIKAVKAGEIVEISIDLVAPNDSGRFVTYFRLREPSGERFGSHVWVDIEVVKPLKDAYQMAKEEFLAQNKKIQLQYEVFESHVKRLWEMGYQDIGRNVFLLEKYEGDLNKVVSYFIERGF